MSFQTFCNYSYIVYTNMLISINQCTQQTRFIACIHEIFVQFNYSFSYLSRSFLFYLNEQIFRRRPALKTHIHSHITIHTANVRTIHSILLINNFIKKIRKDFFLISSNQFDWGLWRRRKKYHAWSHQQQTEKKYKDYENLVNINLYILWKVTYRRAVQVCLAVLYFIVRYALHVYYMLRVKRLLISRAACVFVKAIFL